MRFNNNRSMKIETLNYFMKLTRATLRSIGLWPDPECRNERLTLYHFMISLFLLFFTVVLTQNIQFFLNWGDLDVISDILSLHLPILVSLVKMIVLRCCRRKMQKLLTFIIKDWDNKTSKEYNIMIEYGQFSKKICIGMLKDTFNPILFAQLFANSVQFCIQGYQLIYYFTDKNSKSVFYDMMYIVMLLSYMILMFYLYCYVAETLQFESLRLAQTVYNSDWYYLPPQRIRDLLLIIQRSRKPVVITAGNIWVLNSELFAQLLKTSLGYLSVLLTMRNA
ncbi:odorant receptor 67c-like [Belonocnema kinseyi]|uniref:odorant receptor 67c-like n=1 Tax=Belonocnema kinseyi TaxID=2817044 RepID=UPI00143D6880|nr:odorant receptor 67c-like [Belonocnema kinseyi]